MGDVQVRDHGRAAGVEEISALPTVVGAVAPLGLDVGEAMLNAQGVMARRCMLARAQVVEQRHAPAFETHTGCCTR